MRIVLQTLEPPVGGGMMDVALIAEGEPYVYVRENQ
jgi:hypothetical protein